MENFSGGFLVNFARGYTVWNTGYHSGSQPKDFGECIV